MNESWDIIHEMDMEDGTPTCYTRKFGDQPWWVNKFPDCWIAETKVKIFEEPEIASIKKFKSAKAGINWVEKNYQNWTKRAWE